MHQRTMSAFLTLMTIVAIGAMITVGPANGQQQSSTTSVDKAAAAALADDADPVEMLEYSQELLQNPSSVERQTDNGAQIEAQVNIYVSVFFCVHQSYHHHLVVPGRRHTEESPASWAHKCSLCNEYNKFQFPEMLNVRIRRAPVGRR